MRRRQFSGAIPQEQLVIARNQNMITLFRVLTRVHREESGQDLIEYALVVALIALAATAGMSTVASSINQAFSTIGSILNSYI